MLRKKLFVVMALLSFAFIEAYTQLSSPTAMAPLTVVNTAPHSVELTIGGQVIALNPGEKTTLDKELKTYTITVNRPVGLPGLQFHHTQRTKVTWDGNHWTRTYQD